MTSAIALAPTSHQQSRRGLAAAWLSGTAYVLALIFADPLSRIIWNLPPTDTFQAIVRNGDALMIFQLAILAPALMLAYASLRGESTARSRGAVGGIFAVLIVLFLGMDHWGLWPFTWKGEGNNSLPIYVALISGRNWLGLLAVVARDIIAIPILEEVLFRKAMLQTLLKWWSPGASLAMTSLVFGVLHLPPAGPATWNIVILMNAFWAGWLGALLGFLAMRDGGSLRRAVMAHGTRNFVEFATGIVAVLR